MNLVGANRRKVDTIFRSHGGTINRVYRTGEVVYNHPSFPHPMKFNGRRKDCARLLTKLVMRVASAA